jgi:hypothetical protein
MLAASFIAIFIIPTTFYVTQRLHASRRRPAAPLAAAPAPPAP